MEQMTQEQHNISMMKLIGRLLDHIEALGNRVAELEGKQVHTGQRLKKLEDGE